MKMYVVEALRWGDRERHSYVVGVYTDKSRAKLAAKVETDWRAGKYDCVINECELDNIPTNELDWHLGIVRVVDED